MSPRGFFTAPLWLAGFRPFFLLALIAGAVYPPLWALVFSGAVALPAAGLTPLQWHAHEMLFGFGWAVLGGFLLTASKNWVGVRGLHGGPLALAAALWLAERVLIFHFPALTDSTPWPLRAAVLAAASLPVLGVGGYVLWTLVRYRRQDSFKDNGFFIAALPLLLAAKLMLLLPPWVTEGRMLAIGLFRLAFVVMFERTLTQFMKNTAGVTLFRHPALDWPIKGLMLLAAFAGFLPPAVAAAVMTAAGLLLLYRFGRWHPLAGLRRFDTGIMYVGYLGLSANLFAEALRLSGVFPAIGSLSVHIFTFVCMGLVIPGMLVRISQGHTGRRIVFTATDKAAISLMGAGAVLRLVATQLWPQHYGLWIDLSALAWSGCFLGIGLRLAPMLWQARVDGREL
ncbi:uncharacterized protein involved in response to NO [Fluviicoccus keumensis]|uniref:Uncharacterized protein involved in response to NO n=2 Tax=Fluviicoccus keumensis TaxID=1435465 RepID=A0A4Q7YLP4_9GAMM|nr:uncharacterized protein involved in response to NO [Fluviicoccus keumensis]